MLLEGVGVCVVFLILHLRLLLLAMEMDIVFIVLPKPVDQVPKQYLMDLVDQVRSTDAVYHPPLIVCQLLHVDKGIIMEMIMEHVEQICRMFIIVIKERGPLKPIVQMDAK